MAKINKFIWNNLSKMGDIFRNLNGCQMNMKEVFNPHSKVIWAIFIATHSNQVKIKDFLNMSIPFKMIKMKDLYMDFFA